MSNDEPSKARIRPEILVTLIVAIIALIGTLGAAVIGNMDKIWPKSSPANVPSSTVAGTPQSAPSAAPVNAVPVNAAPVNIAGTWRDNFGNVTHVVQHGDAVTATASGIACRGHYDSSGSGTIIGNILESTYQSTYSIGRCRGTISADGTRIKSLCHDSVCGPFEASSVKVE